MPVSIHPHQQLLGATTGPRADLTAAITDLQTDLHALRQSHLRHTDDHLDQLSQQFSTLQRDVTSLLLMPHQTCASIDFDSKPCHWETLRSDCHHVCKDCCSSQHIPRGRYQPSAHNYLPPHSHGNHPAYDHSDRAETPYYLRHHSYSPSPLQLESHTPYTTHSPLLTSQTS